MLRDNYFQTQVLSVTRARGVALLDEQSRFMRKLGNSGRLNRKIEFLPFDEELGERKASRIGLVTPELAVLLAYSKIELYDLVLASDVPKTPTSRPRWSATSRCRCANASPSRSAVTR